MDKHERECYMEDYLTEISHACKNAEVTDSWGGMLRLEQGMKILAEKTEFVKSAKGLLFFCGNGASATMAEHMSHDYFQNAEVNTTTCAETAHITAVSNDLTFEEVFCYRINRILGEKDILVTISSSGNSPNVIKAAEAARGKGSYIVTFSGKAPENPSRKIGDLNFYVPLWTYGMVESAHAVLLHGCLDYYLDKYMEGRH